MEENMFDGLKMRFACSDLIRTFWWYHITPLHTSLLPLAVPAILLDSIARLSVQKACTAIVGAKVSHNGKHVHITEPVPGARISQSCMYVCQMS